MRRGLLLRLFRCRKGATALEFGLVLAPLMAFTFGIFEFGRMFWDYEALQQTAIAGARCMGIRASSCASGGTYNAGNTTTYIQGIASGWGLTIPSGNITLSNSATCAGVSGLSRVQLTYAFTTVLPQILVSLASGEALTASACFPNNP